MLGTSVIEKWPELRKLTAKQVLDGVERCAGEERDALLKFLLYLSEVERRRAYEEAGVDKRSLWEYLEETLGFTVCETRLRYHSAKLLLRFPIVAEYLADGRLSMTTLVVMKDHLTPKNVHTECEKASRKSKADVEKQVAEKNPPVIDFGMISKGPAPTIVEAAAASPAAQPAEAVPSTQGQIPATPGMNFLVQNAPSRSSVKAFTSQQDILSMTLQPDDRAMVEDLRDLLSEVVPDRDIRKVVLHCLKQVHTRILKKRGVIPVRPRRGNSAASGANPVPPVVSTTKDAEAAPAPPSETPIDPPAPEPYAPRHVVVPKDAAIEGRNRDRKFTREAIPDWMARMVWIRDNHRCQRKLKGGKICGSTYRCQIDHILAVADGGKNELKNLQIHCRNHNLQRARERFGTERIERAIRARRGTKRPIEPAMTNPQLDLIGTHPSANPKRR